MQQSSTLNTSVLQYFITVLTLYTEMVTKACDTRPVIAGRQCRSSFWRTNNVGTPTHGLTLSAADKLTSK